MKKIHKNRIGSNDFFFFNNLINTICHLNEFKRTYRFLYSLNRVLFLVSSLFLQTQLTVKMSSIHFFLQITTIC